MGWRVTIDKGMGDWIPVTVALPESGSYLVTKRQKSGGVQVAIGNYFEPAAQWSGNGNFKDVLAWMPLPLPYKEGSDDA